MTQDKENAALQVASLKKELEAKKKEVIKLTGERDALKEAAKQKKTGSGASAKDVKELADLRQQVLQGSARETVLREQLESLSNRMIERGSAGASHASVSSTADAVALAGAMKPDYTGMASLLTAASSAVASTCHARGGPDPAGATTASQHTGATTAAQPTLQLPSITFEALEKLRTLAWSDRVSAPKQLDLWADSAKEPALA